MLHLTTGLFLYSHLFQRFLKRLFVIEFITMLTIITFLLMKNFVSGMHHQHPFINLLCILLIHTRLTNLQDKEIVTI